MNIKPNRAKAQATMAYVPPQVKRPRSYGWVFIIAVSLTTLGWWGWDRFARMSAWGMVVADEVAVAAPVGGVIETMRVVEHASYAGGTAAFSVVDIEARNELAGLQIELQLLESRLNERIALHNSQRQEYLYARDTKLADVREQLEEARLDLSGVIQQQVRLRARIPTLKTEYEKLRDAGTVGAATRQEIEVAWAAFDGAEQELEALALGQAAGEARIDALEQSYHRPIPGGVSIDLVADPISKQSELVRQRIQQVHSRLDRQTVSLPTSGVVRRIVRRPGEFVGIGDTVVILQEPSSMRLVAYVEQRWLARLEMGEVVRVVSTYAPPVRGVVSSLTPQLEPGPLQIAVRHPKGSPLLPVEIMLDETGQRLLIPGSTVRILPSNERSPSQLTPMVRGRPS